MVDANQLWSVPGAISYMRELAPFKLWFVIEPISSDDVLGHKAIEEVLKPRRRLISASQPERCARADLPSSNCCKSHAIDLCQIDACRIGGVNEVSAVMLMANKYVFFHPHFSLYSL